MAKSINFTPLYGCQDDNTPVSYLLEVDGFKLLLDCGWDESTNPELLEPLKDVASEIDAVLLSHPDLRHLGALPYVVGKLGLKAPILSTIPVKKMGEMFIYQLYESRYRGEDFDVFTLDDVDAAFEQIKQLTYTQHYDFVTAGITVTPHAAGHMLGGTVWRITKETEEIVYAIDYNHKRERHLNGIENLEKFRRPSLLITDAHSVGSSQVKKRDSQFIDHIMETLRNGGNALVCADTAGRVLETLLVLEQHWERHRVPYDIAFLNDQAYNAIEVAKSQLEWMSDTIHTDFQTKRYNPFFFRRIHIKWDIEQVHNEIREPCVVVTSSPSLETGYSRDMFVSWASNPRNTVIFTEKSFPHTLGRQMMDQADHISEESPFKTSLVMRRRVPLQGEELRQWQEEERRRERQREEERRREILANQPKIQLQDAGNEDEDEGDQNDDEDRATQKVHPRLFMPENFAYQSNHLMFPCVEPSGSWDEYGEVIDADEIANRMVRDMDEEEDETTPMEDGAEEEKKIPTKCEVYDVELEVKCNIRYFNFEGVSDERSVKNILSQISPRTMILINGTSEATQKMKTFCEEKKIGQNIYSPNVGEPVNVDIDVNVLSVHLRDDLMSTTSFKEFGDYEVGYLQGQFVGNQESGLSIAPLSHNHTPTQSHPSVMIGDIKLSSLRDKLTKAGFETEFFSGDLVCNRSVVLKRTDYGKINIEGALCDDYFKVREVLMQQFAIL
eukprot:gb/GECH01001176.1/.p1 GENE.gb/GECH01001176.1/~~gb/GECH01001176.1/.p1  ORF type:complete len:727 (+),score=167.88 gb/GECH01001176.1/:1-2181(+)